MTQKNAVMVEETAAVVNALATQAGTLNAITNQFKSGQKSEYASTNSRHAA
jgi:methyl-accepting chemotaxis protein